MIKYIEKSVWIHKKNKKIEIVDKRAQMNFWQHEENKKWFYTD